MRIGFDGGCLANRRGFGRFARETLKALARLGSAHEFVVFVDSPSADTIELPESVEPVIVPVGLAPSQAASSTGRRSLGDLLAMGRAAARGRLDLMYFPATYSYFPTWSVGRLVVTMHDTLALARPDLVFPTWQGRLAWTLKEHVAVRRADRILTVSESARRDLLSWFKLPGDRVRVVTEGPEEVFRPLPCKEDSADVLRRWGIEAGERYLLYVGGLSPHKNLLRLIEAFARSGLAARGLRLVLVGDTSDVFHTHVPALREAVAAWSLNDCALFTGFVPDDALVHLYNRALALVQPSLMEGFGLPPVEAMACGIPVLSSTAGSLPEVVGDAGLFFEPTDLDQIAAAIRRIHDEPALRAELAAKASTRAARFTWDASAQATLDCFEELVRKAKPSATRRRSA